MPGIERLSIDELLKVAEQASELRIPALALFAVTVIAAMGWLSHKLLSLQQANNEAVQKAALEESVRLALWRQL